MNLFLYIPAHSAHPPGVLKSLIYGLIKTYQRQNSRVEDFKHNIRLLFGRLIARGHKYNDIITIFQEAAKTSDEKTEEKHRKQPQYKNNKQSTKSGKQDTYKGVFFHLPYHPRDITRNNIQQIYSKTCDNEDNLGESFRRMKNPNGGGTMKIEKLTVAYSRGKNIRDVLCKTTLKSTETCSVSQYL
jgi:hypothetical protein